MSTYQAGSARDRVSALSRAGLPWAEFGERALAVLTKAVPFDSACFGTVDPTTTLVTGSVKSGLEEPCEAEFARHEYIEDDVSLFADLARRNVDVSVLHEETGGDPRRSSRFRDLFEPTFGLGHEMRVMLRTGGAVWGALAIYRRTGASGFSPAEAEFLGGLAGQLAVGVRAGLIADALPGHEIADAEAGPAVLTFDHHNALSQATLAAQVRVDELGGSMWGELPQSVLATVSATRALIAGRTGTVPRMRVRSRTGEWLAVHGAPLAGRDGCPSQIVVTIERAGAPEVVPLVVAALGLTPRERDVVDGVLRGATTAEIAKGLHLSPYTVQDHLKIVFDKAGVSSRRELTARVYFDHYAPRKDCRLGPSGWFVQDA
ncbi:LuxR C-terminal-related transcriptional regulator [Prescottella agglutinans]|uniref:DNA-binding CsgD family transcriptional regulator n=1 Tax=Prescottella agglutinans TaxID=1644129 RepID=A0ABT6MI87_9NOCA|nr:LuxR C-terminal-related transcriptional regulator [Prescottella agglutinans]MDH6283029.1 DNA-binding CsgD family transcriptional regulator [Prescottella agglutinans]